MKCLSCYTILTLISCALAQTNKPDIRNVYLDASTKLIQQASGTVIIELANGVKSTICMNSANSTNDAMVACRSLNYNNLTQQPVNSRLSAIAYISSKKTTLAQAYFQNLGCLGTETSLQQCPGYSYTTDVNFRCTNNNQDLNVYCLYDYTFAQDRATDGNCTPNLTWVRNSSLIQLNFAGNNVFFCGSRNLFGVNEAKLFCRMLCQRDTYARIVQAINMTGLSVSVTIGGFNNMTCPPNAVSLASCNNPYPYQRDGCAPSDNIGVSCDLQPVATDSLPVTICGRNFLTLMWNISINIQPGDVSIIYLNVTCPNVTKTSNNQTLNLTVAFDVCNSGSYGDVTNIIYTYFAKRTYPTSGGTILKSDQLYKPSCYIPRAGIATQGPISINPASIDGGSGNVNIPTQLDIFSDAALTQPILQLKALPIGTIIFVRVMMINPPPRLVLVLVNCAVRSGTTAVPLIVNRCPVADKNVQINPDGQIMKYFNFPSFDIPGSTSLAVVCETSKCGVNEIGCQTSC